MGTRDLNWRMFAWWGMFAWGVVMDGVRGVALTPKEEESERQSRSLLVHALRRWAFSEIFFDLCFVF